MKTNEQGQSETSYFLLVSLSLTLANFTSFSIVFADYFKTTFVSSNIT